MGYFLLYESMLDTIIFARDKWLVKENGIIMPDKFHLNLAGFEDKHLIKGQKQLFWDNVYDINMDCLGRLLYVEPTVETLDLKSITTTACRFYSLDLLTCTKEDSYFANQYSIEMNRTHGKVDGICAWFDVEFIERLIKPVTFTTSPYTTSTHWKQTVFYIDGEYDLEQGDELYGSIAIRKNKRHPRELDIKISFNCRD